LIFRGTFEHALDAKHRLTVPAKFRAEFAGGLVLAAVPPPEPDAPRTLAMRTPAAFEAFTQEALKDHRRLGPTAVTLSRVLFANSHDLELDSANRVMIPQSLMAFAGLEKDCMVIGNGDCLEIWDRATYQDYNEQALLRFSEITASFDHTA
jgi:MraZ protein